MDNFAYQLTKRLEMEYPARLNAAALMKPDHPVPPLIGEDYEVFGGQHLEAGDSMTDNLVRPDDVEELEDVRQGAFTGTVSYTSGTEALAGQHQAESDASLPVSTLLSKRISGVRFSPKRRRAKVAPQPLQDTLNKPESSAVRNAFMVDCTNERVQENPDEADASLSNGPSVKTAAVDQTSVPKIVLALADKMRQHSEEGPTVIQERVHRMVEAFQVRTDRAKAALTQASSPDSLTDEEDNAAKLVDMKQRLDSLVPDMSSRPNSAWQALAGVPGTKALLQRTWLKVKHALTPSAAVEPTSLVYITWLVIASSCYIFNAITIPLRVVFSEYQHDGSLRSWMICDYFCDLVYLLDIILFNFRVKFIDNGFWVGEPKQIRSHYARGKRFKIDLLSLLPLDILYLKVGPKVALRLPRLLKIHVFWDCFHRLDSVFSSPHVVRLTRTVLYMLFIIHLNCCAYYGMSKLQGIGSNSWVFSGEGHSYIRCFYFATKTVISIGKNPRPTNDYEHVFMTISWLLGVFIFALLLGQVRDIMATATRAQTEYRAMMDATQNYVRKLNLPIALQDRIKLWFTYTWQSQKTLDENAALDYLPMKMHTDVALNVHISTLAKVQLFQDCDKALLRDLVLKLQPVIYLPGDYVCRKGEVGKEMYIIQSGEVQVLGGPDNNTVFATLSESCVFGEVALLSVGSGNRRTADVRSRGFSNLFVLSKADLHQTIQYYPEAQEILRKKASKMNDITSSFSARRRLLKQTLGVQKTKDCPEENILFKEREGTPKLMKTVLQAVRQDSYTASVIRRASKTLSQSPFGPDTGIVPCPLHTPPPDHSAFPGINDRSFLQVPTISCGNDNGDLLLKATYHPRDEFSEYTQLKGSSTNISCNIGQSNDDHPENISSTKSNDVIISVNDSDLGDDEIYDFESSTGPELRGGRSNTFRTDTGGGNAGESNLAVNTGRDILHRRESLPAHSVLAPVDMSKEGFDLFKQNSERRKSAIEIETIQEVTEKLYSQFVQQLAKNLQNEEDKPWDYDFEPDNHDILCDDKICPSRSTRRHNAKSSETWTDMESLKLRPLELLNVKMDSDEFDTSDSPSEVTVRRTKSGYAGKSSVRFKKVSPMSAGNMRTYSKSFYSKESRDAAKKNTGLDALKSCANQRFNSFHKPSTKHISSEFYDASIGQSRPSLTAVSLPKIVPKCYQECLFSSRKDEDADTKVPIVSTKPGGGASHVVPTSPLNKHSASGSKERSPSCPSSASDVAGPNGIGTSIYSRSSSLISSISGPAHSQEIQLGSLFASPGLACPSTFVANDFSKEDYEITQDSKPTFSFGLFSNRRHSVNIDAKYKIFRRDFKPTETYSFKMKRRPSHDPTALISKKALMKNRQLNNTSLFNNTVRVSCDNSAYKPSACDVARHCGILCTCERCNPKKKRATSGNSQTSRKNSIPLCSDGINEEYLKDFMSICFDPEIDIEDDVESIKLKQESLLIEPLRSTVPVDDNFVSSASIPATDFMLGTIENNENLPLCPVDLELRRKNLITEDINDFPEINTGTTLKLLHFPREFNIIQNTIFHNDLSPKLPLNSSESFVHYRKESCAISTVNDCKETEV